MNEAETRAELIDPKIKAAGWGDMDGSIVRREFNITKGEIIGEVVNPLDGEVLQKVTAPENGLLFIIREHPLVYSGAPLARMARKDID